MIGITQLGACSLQVKLQSHGVQRNKGLLIYLRVKCSIKKIKY